MTPIRSVRRPRVATWLGLALVASVVAGCAGFTTDPALTLGLDNDTDRPVLVYVNDEWVGTFPVGADRDDITTSAHGGPPWRIEVRTDEGAVLAGFDAASDAALPTGIAAGTTCGDLAVWAGDPRPAALERTADTMDCD